MTAGRGARTEYESRRYNKLQEEPAGRKWYVFESTDDQPRFLTLTAHQTSLWPPELVALEFGECTQSHYIYGYKADSCYLDKIIHVVEPHMIWPLEKWNNGWTTFDMAKHEGIKQLFKKIYYNWVRQDSPLRVFSVNKKQEFNIAFVSNRFF